MFVLELTSIPPAELVHSAKNGRIAICLTDGELFKLTRIGTKVISRHTRQEIYVLRAKKNEIRRLMRQTTYEKCIDLSWWRGGVCKNAFSYASCSAAQDLFQGHRSPPQRKENFHA